MKNQTLNIFFTDSKRPSKPWRKNPKQRNVNFKPCTNKELFPWLTKRKKFQWIVTPRPWTITHPILIECKNVCKSCWELCTKTVTILFNILDTCWKQVLSRYYSTCEALKMVAVVEPHFLYFYFEIQLHLATRLFQLHKIFSFWANLIITKSSQTTKYVLLWIMYPTTYLVGCVIQKRLV